MAAMVAANMAVDEAATVAVVVVEVDAVTVAVVVVGGEGVVDVVDEVAAAPGWTQELEQAAGAEDGDHCPLVRVAVPTSPRPRGRWRS